MVEIFKKYKPEYQANIDRFSQDLIITQLELLLIYAERFYERHSQGKRLFELLDRFEFSVIPR